MLRPFTALWAAMPILAQFAAAQAPADDEIRQVLVKRVDQEKQAVGIVVGIIEPKGRRVVAYGSLAKGDSRTLNGGTIFEIGSISKVFTSLLLSDMVQRKEVALDDPASKYLPDAVKVPERNGKSITLLHLSTHTSGLPRLPNNITPKDPGNPYADYTVDQLYAFLSGYTLPRDPGAEFEYSNLGGGLLGHILARRAGTEYETLLQTRITRPLKMQDTAIRVTASMRERFATGHNEMLAPVPYWDLPTLAGAGAIRSSTNDMLTFLEAFLGYKDSPLAPAMKAMLEPRHAAGAGKIGLAWLINSAAGTDVICHDGGTGGFRTFIGFDPAARVGVVVLSNTSTAPGVDDIGMHLLNPKFPLANFKPARQHTEITLDSTVLDRYAGRYQLAPNFILEVTRDGGHMFAQATGQPKLEIFPEGEKDFFLKVVDAQLTFETGSDGVATKVVLHQNGRDVPGARLP